VQPELACLHRREKILAELRKEDPGTGAKSQEEHHEENAMQEDSPW
jgi:hypothetical protein